jgi:hypothetical protein
VVAATTRTLRALSPEQRVAGAAAILLVVSTFGPFSFIEAAEILIALAILLLLKTRADGRHFHLPFGDGTMIAAAGLWCAALILIRLFERPFGLELFALGCAALLTAAGIRERARRPPDDMPRTRRFRRGEPGWLDEDPPVAGRRRGPAPAPPPRVPPSEAPTSAAPTEPLPGEQRTLPLPEVRDDLPEVSEPPELKLPNER